MSVGIQATTEEKIGLETETGFVAGGNADARHDAETVTKLGDMLSVDYHGKSATQILDMPMLIHKSLMPNGVVDLVKLYDEAAGGMFFGEQKPQQDYVAYAEQCEHRQQAFKPRVDRIVAQLLKEADTIWSPLAATKRLHKISEEQMAEHALTDRSIDSRVFGPVAAPYLEQARMFHEQGDTQAASKMMTQVKATAQSSSCPSGGSNLTAEFLDATSQNESGSTGKKERMKCPFCKDKNQYGDPCSSNQHCTSCDARVSGGKVVNTGNGGKKSRKIVPKLPKPLPAMAELVDIEQKRRTAAAQLKLSKLPAVA